MKGPTHYRIHDLWSENGAVHLSVEKLLVLRETPAGYWLLDEYHYSHLGTFPEWEGEHRRWAPKEGSRYAQSTMEAALRSFNIRKQAQRRHLKSALAKCEHVLAAWGAIDPAKLIEAGYQDLGFTGKQFDLLAPPKVNY